MPLRPLALALVLLVDATAPALLGAQAATPEPPRPHASYSLCARITAPTGWGSTCSTVSQPGPDLTAQQGETVDLSLLAGDGPLYNHQWVLDANMNGAPDPGEPASAVFSSPTTPTTFSFTVNLVPGTYQYICGVHLTAQSGRFIVTGATRPTVSLTIPDGVTTNRWSGGSPHRLEWTMDDPNGLPSMLAVWLNYTSSAGSGVIAGPPTLPLGATAYVWTVPMIDASDVRVLIDVVDPEFQRASDGKLVPIVDSTRPAVSSVFPTPGATDVDATSPVILNFSEAMDRAATEAAFSIAPNPGGLSFSWSNGDRTMTVNHAPFQAATTYTPLLGTGARDISSPGNAMAAPYSWSFSTRNASPAVAVTSPNGGERWTGASFHDIVWTMSDVDSPGTLAVSIAYSTDGGATYPNVILSSAAMSQGTQTYGWTVPATDSNTVRVRVCASDGNSQGCDASDADFAIDATPPTVLSTNPGAGATNVPLNAMIQITFSEPMDWTATARPGTVGLEKMATGTWVDLDYSGVGAVLTATPRAPLEPFTDYRIFVNASAEDASDPGNSLAGAFGSLFTTGGAADTTPPAISGVAATPPTQVSGGSVEIAATVTDDVGVASVHANVTQPDGNALNLTMTRTGTRWAVTRAWTQVGEHTFVLWAVDTSGNAASVAGAFTITAADTTPPTIAHSPPAGPFYAGSHIDIHATVTDAGGVQEVRLIYRIGGGAEQNVSMLLDAGVWHYEIFTPDPGTVEYRIYAVDAAGNRAETATYSLTVTAGPSADATLPILAGLVFLIAVVAAAVLLLRRRRKGGEAEPPKGP